MLELLAALAWVAMELVMALSGKLFVQMISLGRWRSESLDGVEGRMHGPAGALSFKRDDPQVIASSGLVLAGLAFYVLLGFVALMVSSLV